MALSTHQPTPLERARCFVRDDDVGPLTDELKAFAEAFMSREIPVSYQVIPARLTDECADYLLALERDRPDLIEFGQHGLHHQMTLRGRTLKREFGPERTFEQQSADISRGLEMLYERLGRARRIEIFTPPQHKFDRSTVRAAAGVGHGVFSVAAYATARHQAAYRIGRRLALGSVLHHGISFHLGERPEARIREVSISVAADNGRFVTTPSSALPAAVAAAGRWSDVVGVMYHHAIYRGREGRDAVDAAAAFFSSLLKGRMVKLGEALDPESSGSALHAQASTR